MTDRSVDLLYRADPVHGEGPWWDARGSELLWVDILGCAIHRYDTASARAEVISVPEHIGAVVGRASGGMVALLRDGFAYVDDGGAIEWLAPVGPDDPTMRFNDGKCDPWGRLLGGTYSYDHVPGSGVLYRLGADHQVTPLLGGLSASNGLAWNEDGSVMYLIDSVPRTLSWYRYGPEDGGLASSEPLGRIVIDRGIPDGMTIDADGCPWVALIGAGTIQRYTPDGRPDVAVELPVSGVTSCVFGGSLCDELYVTTTSYGLDAEQRRAEPLAGSVFVCRPGVVGRPEPPFAG